MFRLIFPSRHHRGRWLSGAAPILSDPKTSLKNSLLAPETERRPDVNRRRDEVLRWHPLVRTTRAETSVSGVHLFRFVSPYGMSVLPQTFGDTVCMSHLGGGLNRSTQHLH